MSEANPEIAVIFSSQLASEHAAAYPSMAEKMVALAKAQPGFLRVESARGADGFGITVSYWADEASVAAWKANTAHLVAQEKGKTDFYESYNVLVATVNRQYTHPAP